MCIRDRIGTWLLFLPCLWAVTLAANAGGFRPWDLWLAISCGAGAFLMRGAGCTWNDVTDRKIDASVARTRSRPLPSGQVTVRQALLVPLDAAGAEALFDAFSALPGLGSSALVAALDGKAPDGAAPQGGTLPAANSDDRLVWRRQGRGLTPV